MVTVPAKDSLGLYHPSCRNVLNTSVKIRMRLIFDIQFFPLSCFSITLAIVKPPFDFYLKIYMHISNLNNLLWQRRVALITAYGACCPGYRVSVMTGNR